MQRTPTEIDIDGHVIHTGAIVQVKWLGIWYEGTVAKIGHKRNLYRVRDVLSNETVLLESKHFQPIEAFVMDKRIPTGAHVAYKDGDQWKKGVVDSKSTVGIVMVSWRKSGLSEENVNWFELSHIAPVIHNELYNEHNKERLEAGKSGLLFNDAIEPRPRTMDNMLYESESDNDEEIVTELAKTKSSPSRSTTKHTAPKENFNKPTQDSEHVAAESAAFPTPPAPLPMFPFLPAPMFISYPPMMHSYGNMFLPRDQNHRMNMSPSFTSSPTTLQSRLPHPHSLKRPGLSHTSVPCIMSCTKSANGIPPHPSSNFFRNLRNTKFGKQRPHKKAETKKSESKACSEPTDYATIAEVLEKREQLVKVPKRGSPHTTKHHFAGQAPAHHQLQPSSHSSQLPNATSTPSPLPPPQLQSLTKRDTASKPGSSLLQNVPPPLPPRPHKLPQRPATVPAKQPLLSSTGESPQGVGNALPAADARGVAVINALVSEEDGEEFTSRESEHAHRDKDQAGGALALVSASPAHVTVPHGGATLLTCAVRSSHNVHYEWSRDGKPISEHDPFFAQPAPGMLQIKMASLYLSGEYKCVASVNQNSLERVFHLTVTSDEQVFNQKSANARAGSQLTDKVSPKEPDQEMLPDVATTTEHTVTSSQSRPKPPTITIHEPPAEPPVTTPPPSVDMPKGGRDTPDAKDDKTERKRAENVGTEQEVDAGRRTAKRNRRRVSSAFKNDMEQYLEGYGENYGEQSSKVVESLMEDFSVEVRGQKKRKGKKRRRKIKKSSSEGSSSPTKGTLKKKESPKQPKKNVKLSHAMLGKDKKKQAENEKEPLSKLWKRKAVGKSVKDSHAELDEEETNSVAVHTSVGASSGSEVSLRGSEKEERKGDTLELPKEQESLNDSVRRLQLSVQEYCPEQLQFAEKEKKKGFLSNIFTKNRSH